MTPKVVISFDFELAGGVLEHDRWRYRESLGVYRRMRTDVPELLVELKNGVKQ